MNNEIDYLISLIFLNLESQQNDVVEVWKISRKMGEWGCR